MPGTTKATQTAEPSQLSLKFNLLNTKVSALLLTGSGTLADDAKQIIALSPPLEALPSALWQHRPQLLWFTGQTCTCTVCVSSSGCPEGLFKESPAQPQMEREKTPAQGLLQPLARHQLKAACTLGAPTALYFPYRNIHPQVLLPKPSSLLCVSQDLPLPDAVQPPPTSPPRLTPPLSFCTLCLIIWRPFLGQFSYLLQHFTYRSHRAIPSKEPLEDPFKDMLSTLSFGSSSSARSF